MAAKFYSKSHNNSIPMIYAFDTYYFENEARTACIAFENWEDKEVYKIYIKYHQEINDYCSGEFYKRELPCILEAIEELPLSKNDLIVVDGYVVLNDDNKQGLGGYLYNALNGEVPIIGVAKNAFSQPNQYCRALIRGESKKPLYITSIGFDLDEAVECIKKMDGEFRMPTLLKKLDQLSRADDELTL